MSKVAQLKRVVDTGHCPARGCGHGCTLALSGIYFNCELINYRRNMACNGLYMSDREAASLMLKAEIERLMLEE